MGRVAKNVDKTLLTQAIEQAEKDGPLRNHNELWKAAAEIYNSLIEGSSNEPISFSVVMLRVNDWKIPIKTQAGKRGRQKGESVRVVTPAPAPVPVATAVAEPEDDEDEEPLIPPKNDEAPRAQPRESVVYTRPQPVVPVVRDAEPQEADGSGCYTRRQIHAEICAIRSGSLATDKSGIYEAYEIQFREDLHQDAGLVERVIRNGHGGFFHAPYAEIVDVLTRYGCVAENVPAHAVEELEVA